MGREWYRSRSLRRREERDVPERPSGCMSGMLQLLHFRQLLLFPSQHHPRHQRPPAYAAMRDSSVRGGVGIRADALDFGRGKHQSFQSLVTEAKQELQDTRGQAGIRLARQSVEAAALVTASEKKNEKTPLEDDGRSIQVETPRTSNVVARLMGLDELPIPDATPRSFCPSSAPMVLPSRREPRYHEQKENCGGKKQQRRQGEALCGRDDTPLSPALRPRRKPLNVRNSNILELDGSRSLPGTPRLSSSSRRSFDGETPRLSLQLSPALKEFDHLCEIVPDSKELLSASRTPSASLTKKFGNNRNSVQPQLQCGEKKRSDAGTPDAVVLKQHSKEPAADRRTSGHGRDGNIRDAPVGRRTSGREKKKTIVRCPSSSFYLELTGENTSEAKQVVAETVVVHKVDVRLPNPAPSSSSPFPECRAAEGKKAKVAEPSTDRFTEKLRRPPSEKVAVRTRSGVLTRRSNSLSIQSRSQVLSPTPSGSPPQQASLGRPLTVRPTQEQNSALEQREQPAAWLSPLLHGSTEWSSSNNRRPGDDDGSCYPEFRYVRKILECVGLLNCTSKGLPASLARWHSPSHPVDPMVFYRIELFLPEEEDELRQLGCLRQRCNRKLFFHLVEEILADLLRPSFGVKPFWPSNYHAAGTMAAAVVMETEDGGEALLRFLWSRIRRLRPADRFQNMPDVDALLVGMGSDTSEDRMGHLSPLHPAVREEVETITTVIEEGIFSSLLEELQPHAAICQFLSPVLPPPARRHGGWREGTRASGREARSDERQILLVKRCRSFTAIDRGRSMHVMTYL